MFACLKGKILEEAWPVGDAWTSILKGSAETGYNKAKATEIMRLGNCP